MFILPLLIFLFSIVMSNIVLFAYIYIGRFSINESPIVHITPQTIPSRIRQANGFRNNGANMRPPKLSEKNQMTEAVIAPAPNRTRPAWSYCPLTLPNSMTVSR